MLPASQLWHNSADGFDLLSGVLDCIDAIKHSSSEIYGISFHPEVRNRWILENFSRL
jgi:GMP synthase (glutamine-hydrolysing)